VGTAAMSKGRTTMLGATYDFGVAKAALIYAANRGTVNINNTINPNGQADSRDLLLGVTVPYGPHTFRASVIDKKDRAGTKRGADQWGVGYSYYLSRRTDVYLAYASIDNDAAKGSTGFYTVGNATEVGSGDRAINLGLRHTF
jgi:predicted porin